MKRIIGQYRLGDMAVAYVEETKNHCCGMLLYPLSMAERVSLEGNWRVDSLVQAKIVGDAYPVGFSNGHTMRNSQTVEKLRLTEQRFNGVVRYRRDAGACGEEENRMGDVYSAEDGRSAAEKQAEDERGAGDVCSGEENRTGNMRGAEDACSAAESGAHSEAVTIETVLESDQLRALHRLSWQPGAPYISTATELINVSGQPVLLEMLSSFSICGLFPFGKEERMEDFALYRLRSKWSAEGRLTKESFLSLQMEPSWQRCGVQSIRFGEVGSMPVREFFPWAAAEDARNHVMLGAQLYHNGSWQMELYGRDERAALSGGLADREFGHWMKRLEPKEHFLSPKAVLTTCTGDVDELSWRLTLAQKEGREQAPLVEKRLPVLFNEFCTTWGNPTQENVERIAEAIRGKGFTYCVIDAGWYSIGEGDWNGDMGDWNINQKRFPGGFDRAVAAIRNAGMIPGLWFELECVGQAAQGFAKEEWQLKRDGVPLQTGLRRFWDMRKPEVIDYLSERVIGILRRYGFGYLKVDYNDNIGIGCDGAESLGEGLRQQMAASQRFFEKLRQELPELVIENCSSGGHRLEPSMQALTSMSSFSDAHECVHIPVVAANVHRAILPEQSQIWAVLRAADDEKRLYYSMTNTLLGRMCLSGDIYDLTRQQWKIVEDGVAFYKKAVPVILDGRSRRFGCEDLNYSHPEGWQAVVREGIADADGLLLVVVHRFYENRHLEGPQDCLEIPLPAADRKWRVEAQYSRGCVHAQIRTEEKSCVLRLTGMEELEAAALFMTTENS